MNLYTSSLCPCGRGPCSHRCVDPGSMDTAPASASDASVRCATLDRDHAARCHCRDHFAGCHLCHRRVAYREPAFLGLRLATSCCAGDHAFCSPRRYDWPPHARNSPTLRRRTDECFGMECPDKQPVPQGLTELEDLDRDGNHPAHRGKTQPAGVSPDRCLFPKIRTVVFVRVLWATLGGFDRLRRVTVDRTYLNRTPSPVIEGPRAGGLPVHRNCANSCIISEHTANARLRPPDVMTHSYSDPRRIFSVLRSKSSNPSSGAHSPSVSPLLRRLSVTLEIETAFGCPFLSLI
jgi:hypothetical protein